MAEARIEKITRTVFEDGVTLRLTMEEARAVYSALLRIGGDPSKSARLHTDRVKNAIAEAVAPDAGQYDWEWARPEWTAFEGGTGLVAKDYE